VESNRRRTCSPYDEELDSAERSDEPADSRRNLDPVTAKGNLGSLSRWVGSKEAMAGRARCLETEFMRSPAQRVGLGGTFGMDREHVGGP
jgi:hypothetical protein